MAEMTEQEELQVFQLITAAGSAKSSSMDKISNQQAVFFMCPPPSAACFFSLHPV